MAGKREKVCNFAGPLIKSGLIMNLSITGASGASAQIVRYAYRAHTVRCAQKAQIVRYAYKENWKSTQ